AHVERGELDRRRMVGRYMGVSQRRLAGPNRRVVAMSAAMGLAVLAVAVARLLTTGPSVGHEVAPAWALAAMFAVTEGFVVHLRVRRGGHALSLSEIPLVLGVLGTDPTVLVLTRVVGGTLGFAVLRRQRGVKLGFNVALVAVQASTAPAVYRLVAGSGY